MRIGALDRRIIIEVNTPTQDSFGDEVETWTTFLTLWANVKQTSGNENFNEDQTVAVRTTIFRVRYHTGINERMRISYNGNFYDIEFIKELGRLEGLEITGALNNP